MSDTPATPTRTDYGYGCFASDLGKKGVPLVAAFDEQRNDGIIFAYVVQAPFHISRATQKANADYTVLALNSHATLLHQRDALVKALENDERAFRLFAKEAEAVRRMLSTTPPVAKELLTLVAQLLEKADQVRATLASIKE